jgi:integrase
LDTDRPSFFVPGLKTDGSQRTLPLTDIAAGVARRRLAACEHGKLFPIAYCVLKENWVACRKFLGQEGMRTCTLRALRRSFAKYANDRGMPTEKIRDYLRHSSIKTTQIYLDLVGGFDTEEMRKWL